MYGIVMILKGGKKKKKKSQAKNVIIQLKFLKSVIQKHKTGEVKDVPE